VSVFDSIALVVVVVVVLAVFWVVCGWVIEAWEWSRRER
jgi:hypothetical protein